MENKYQASVEYSDFLDDKFKLLYFQLVKSACVKSFIKVKNESNDLLSSARPDIITSITYPDKVNQELIFLSYTNL